MRRGRADRLGGRTREKSRRKTREIEKEKGGQKAAELLCKSENAIKRDRKARVTKKGARWRLKRMQDYENQKRERERVGKSD